MEFEQQKPIYLQIADYICEKILKEEWNEKDRIPSVRELAISLEVNPNTVVKSYGSLEAQEIIQKQRGIGYFVTHDAEQKVKRIQTENFLQNELPRILNKMKLLGLDYQLLNIGEQHENQQ